jgi:hypothetical protein
VIAILLTFILSPPVTLGRVPAVIVVVLLAILLIGALAGTVSLELQTLSTELPPNPIANPQSEYRNPKFEEESTKARLAACELRISHCAHLFRISRFGVRNLFLTFGFRTGLPISIGLPPRKPLN